MTEGEPWTKEDVAAHVQRHLDDLVPKDCRPCVEDHSDENNGLPPIHWARNEQELHGRHWLFSDEEWTLLLQAAAICQEARWNSIPTAAQQCEIHKTALRRAELQAKSDPEQ